MKLFFILLKFLKKKINSIVVEIFKNFKLREPGIKPWPSTKKHVGCEENDHKDKKRTLKLSYKNVIYKFVICREVQNYHKKKKKKKTTHEEFYIVK